MLPSASVKFVEILNLLLAEECDFVLIGGLATQIHGGDHLTYVLDISIIRKRENAKRLAAALAPYHPKPVNWSPELPFVWDDGTIMASTVLTLQTDLGRIDLLAEPDGAPPYATLKERALTFEIGDRTLYVASIEDLISMKRAAGRTKDLAHIAELETIQKLNAGDL